MEDENSNIEETLTNLVDQEKTKKEPKKGLSVTRALVMLGFNDVMFNTYYNCEFILFYI